jgi:hypothetical protein
MLVFKNNYLAYIFSNSTVLNKVLKSNSLLP